MGYSADEVARLLDVTPARLAALLRAGLLSPERDEAGAPRFSFQDLVLLRTAKELLDAEVAPARVRRALERLRERLPDGRPLTALRIAAEGARVVVSDGRARFDPESGQALFDFTVRELERKVAPLAARAAARARAATVERSADDWFALGCQLEVGAPREARAAYEQAVALDPAHADAHWNLSQLYERAGEPQAALRHLQRYKKLTDGR